MALCFGCLLFDLAAFVIVVIGFVYLYFQRCYKFWDKVGIPNFKPTFPLGNVSESVTLKKQFGVTLAEWYDIIKGKGEQHFGIYFFNKPFYVPVHVELVKNIMGRDFRHFYDRGMYVNEEHDPLSATLFSLYGLKWKNLRNKLTPTFTSGKMKKMFQTLVDCSDDLKSCLNEPASKGEPVDIRVVLSNFTTDVIGSCAFGIECNSFKNPNNEFARLGQKIFQIENFARLKLFFAFTFPNFAKKCKIRVTNHEVQTFYLNLVKETIDYREKHNIVRNDFMQLLIQLKNKGYIDQEEGEQHETTDDTKLTFSEVAAQAFLFFVAGYETSSTAMTFTLYELAKNEDIQQKVREEIVNVLKKHDGKITYEAINEMHYLERVVNESLRLHPPIMWLQRICTKDYKIPDTDFVMKKDMMTIISVLGLHRDPEFYPEPEKYDPERFTEEAKASRPDYAFIPFGEGPRVCIGLRFGMMQTKVGLCRLLKNYKFSFNPKTKEPLELVASSFVALVKGGIWLDVERCAN